MKYLLLSLLALGWLHSIAQEVQVPLDIEGTITTIDKKLEKKLTLFPEISNFSEAKLFQLSEEKYVLEIMYSKDGNPVKQREGLTREKVTEFRQKVTVALREKSPESTINQEGRLRYILQSGLIGLGYYATAVPFMVNADDASDPRLFVGTYMLTGGVGIVTPILATRKARVTHANAALGLYGQSRGIGHGIAATFLIDENPNTGIFLGVGMAASVLEGIGGFLWADRTNMTLGSASAINAMGDFGLLIGLGAGHVLDLYGDGWDRKMASSFLIGSAVGITTGAFMTKSGAYTFGDAIVLRNLGMMGAYLPASIVIAISPDEERIYSGAAIAGAFGGIALGHTLANKYEVTSKQGILIAMGSAAGGLIMAGTGYLITGQSDEPGRVIAPLASLGSILGFGLVYTLYDKKGQIEKSHHSFDLDINPYGIVELTTGNKFGPSGMPSSLFSARLKF